MGTTKDVDPGLGNSQILFKYKGGKRDERHEEGKTRLQNKKQEA